MKLADAKILEAWARHTQPEDQYRWALLPQMDYLDPGQSPADDL